MDELLVMDEYYWIDFGLIWSLIGCERRVNLVKVCLYYFFCRYY